MNKNTIPEAVLLCEKQIEQSVDGQLSSSVLSANLIERQLIWSSRKADDWEILVYNRQRVGKRVSFAGRSITNMRLGLHSIWCGKGLSGEYVSSKLAV